MKSGNDYLQHADVAVWMTIGVIAIAVARFINCNSHLPVSMDDKLLSFRNNESTTRQQD